MSRIASQNVYVLNTFQHVLSTFRRTVLYLEEIIPPWFEKDARKVSADYKKLPKLLQSLIVTLRATPGNLRDCMKKLFSSLDGRKLKKTCETLSRQQERANPIAEQKNVHANFTQ
jgi:hypothetical protein